MASYGGVCVCEWQAMAVCVCVNGKLWRCVCVTQARPCFAARPIPCLAGSIESVADARRERSVGAWAADGFGARVVHGERSETMGGRAGERSQ